MYGDGGAGVAIGINTDYFGNGIVRLGSKDTGPHPFTTHEVIYDDVQQKELIPTPHLWKRCSFDRLPSTQR